MSRFHIARRMLDRNEELLMHKNGSFDLLLLVESLLPPTDEADSKNDLCSACMRPRWREMPELALAVRDAHLSRRTALTRRRNHLGAYRNRTVFCVRSCRGQTDTALLWAGLHAVDTLP
jgi:hypothetical protein